MIDTRMSRRAVIASLVALGVAKGLPLPPGFGSRYQGPDIDFAWIADDLWFGRVKSVVGNVVELYPVSRRNGVIEHDARLEYEDEFHDAKVGDWISMSIVMPET